MSGPLDAIGPHQSDGQSKDTARISTNFSVWKESLSKAPWLAIWVNCMMYGILLLVGFAEHTSFSLDPVVLITLVGATAGVSAPHHIRMAINIIRGREE
jgi:hypothetical protein